MIFMLIFWVLIVGSLLVYFIFRKAVKTIENIVFSIILLAAAFLIVAIVTKDPVFSGLGVPVEYEWVVGLFITGLSSWKLYFGPLKERVVKTEREVSNIQTDVKSIKSDTTLLKDKLLK